jgi:hypothetical protein
MASTRKGGKQLEHFQPSDHEHAAYQADAPHGHAQNSARQRKETVQRGGAQQGRFADQTPKGVRKGQ